MNLPIGGMGKSRSSDAVKMLYVEDVVGEKQIGPDDDPHKGVTT